MATIKILHFILLIIMTMMGAVAALFLKKASGFKSLKDLIFNNNLYIGGVIYFLSAILNIYILKLLDYSIVLPLTSITYIWTMLISYFVLKEKITSKKIFGVISILFGVILITIN